MINYYYELIEKLKKQGFTFKDRSLHLAVFDKLTIDKISNGTKKFESRWSKIKCRPYGIIHNGDVVIIKESCGCVVAFFYAEQCSWFVLNQIDKKSLEPYLPDISSNIENCISQNKYLTIMKIDNFVKLSPFTISKRDQQTWVAFTNEEKWYKIELI